VRSFGWPKARGLVINYVDESGPSKGLIRQHDVLQKLNDQILVNGEQFVALVRMHKAGDTIKVTLIREAKSVTVEVKLGERQTADASQADPAGNTFTTWAVESAGPWKQNLSDYIVTPANITNWGAGDATPTLITGTAFSPTGSTLAVRALHAGPIRVDDGSWTIVLPTGDGQEMSVLESATGKIVYRGPVIKGEDDPHAALLPPDARQKIIVWKKALEQTQPRNAVLNYILTESCARHAAGKGTGTPK